LPVADRRTSFAFYAEGLGFHPLGDPAEDGVPEPLQFALNDGVRVMFIPTGGFGWVTGNRVTAPSPIQTATSGRCDRQPPRVRSPTRN